jgi:hypothetical protein
MAENPDYKELLQVLDEFEVEYLIVCGFAVMKYGEPRYTKDLDVWVHSSALNSLRVIEALNGLLKRSRSLVPPWSSLRDDTRFEDLMRRMNFPRTSEEPSHVHSLNPLP